MDRILPTVTRLAARSLRRSFRRHLRRFLRRAEGGLSLEAALTIPMLLMVFAAGYVWFDAFRAQNLSLKATYTVSDMVSRETVPLTETYLNGLQTVFDFMTQSDGPTQIRITAVKCTADCHDETLRSLEMCWSWASGGAQPYDATSFDGVTDAVPLMTLGDTVMITETFLVHEPAFEVMMPTSTVAQRIVMRPRFVPQVVFGEQRCY